MRAKIDELVLKERKKIAERIRVRLLSYQKIDEADFIFLKRYPEYFKNMVFKWRG